MSVLNFQLRAVGTIPVNWSIGLRKQRPFGEILFNLLTEGLVQAARWFAIWYFYCKLSSFGELQNFLESGHPEMEADFILSTIQHEEKHTDVLCVTDWLGVFKRARRNV
ncbi:hypothetical protein RRG08_063645 [Elysia crispata]|uniref:Uncharacterized protein n=1 Tax=Elysia crispata TaxID=231223 RepID=A0AAE0Y6N2_9GAST|nr:hypothetical protein RRG08_063645 [Elysia crispata]